jgi:hypothetical protein
MPTPFTAVNPWFSIWLCLKSEVVRADQSYAVSGRNWTRKKLIVYESNGMQLTIEYRKALPYEVGIGLNRRQQWRSALSIP